MIIEIWHGANLALAFLLELAAFTALGLWGATQGRRPAAKVLLGLTAALAAMLLWGLFAAPEATFAVPALAVLTKLAVFGGAARALHRFGHERAAVAYPLLVLANLAIIHFAW
ncbi:DUF2568 domain-containing protein [Nocardia inohanensis]|uniref:DUF2568 domain-containing protein n=1 Tax=Nocardia inohanensis TaxID=209246 RepID=UPI00082B8626|nr:DUF2568 domain-containing protein [Nocardia inohanensis]